MDDLEILFLLFIFLFEINTSILYFIFGSIGKMLFENDFFVSISELINIGFEGVNYLILFFGLLLLSFGELFLELEILI